MDFHQLEAFYTITKEKNFSRAAEILHLSQSAISTRISNLESQIQANLFIRNGRILKLSKYGEAFEPYAHQILLLVNDAVNRLAQIKKFENSRLEIGTTSRIATYFLPNLLSKFQLAMPNIQILIETIFPEKVMEKLENSIIHIGIVNFPVDEQRFVSIPLIKDRMVLVASPEHSVYTRYKTERKFIFKWLEGNIIINFKNESNYFCSFVDLLEKNMITLKQFITVNNNEAMKQMASQKVGIAFLPEICVRNELKEGSLVEIPIGHTDLFTIVTNLIYFQQEYINPAIPRFITIVQEYLKQNGTDDLL